MTLRSLTLALTLGAGIVPPASGQTVDRVRIHVAVTGSAAVVSAEYRYAPGDEPLELHALRVRGQRLVPDPSLLRAGDLETLPGLHRVRVIRSSGGSTIETVILRYQVEGETTRIPTFTPVPPLPPEGGVEIRVTGEPLPDAAGAVPRFREGDDELVATLGNIPSFLLLPTAEARLTIGRVADTVVLLVLLFGSAMWIRARRRAVVTDA